jgi:hypothetical protein
VTTTAGTVSPATSSTRTVCPRGHEADRQYYDDTGLLVFIGVVLAPTPQPWPSFPSGYPPEPSTWQPGSSGQGTGAARANIKDPDRPVYS